MVVCAQALLPGKQSRYYREALMAVKSATSPVLPARVISDFELSIMKAVREVFGGVQQSGCNFHWAQVLFRKATSMGIFSLFEGHDEESQDQRRAVHKTFRNVLTRSLLPPEHVRRAFALFVSMAPIGMLGWLCYVAKTYIGPTQNERELGSVAFGPGFVDRNMSSPGTLEHTIRTNITPSLVSYNSSSSFHTNDPLHDHPYALQFGRHSPRPSTPTMASTVDSERGQRWSLPLVKPPKFNVDFWNVFHRAQAAMERTNNGMEAAHGQFADLNHHPSLSDFLAAFIKDIDKQCDIAQALRLGKIRNRRPKYVIKEQRIIEILETAMFGTNEELMEATDLLGLVMQGFVGGLHVRNNGTDEDSDAELDNFSDLDLL